MGCMLCPAKTRFHTHTRLPIGTYLRMYVHNSPPLSAHHHSTGKARKQQYHHCMRRVSGRSNRPTDTLSRCATTGNVQDSRLKTQRCCVCILCNSLRRPVHTLEYIHSIYVLCRQLEQGCHDVMLSYFLPCYVPLQPTHAVL